MVWVIFVQGILFLSLIAYGIVGNTLVFVRHSYILVRGPEKKPIDLLIIHLVFANIIIICTKGSNNLATIFHLRDFLGDLGCKLVLYLVRVARGLSICTTCLLSVLQAITIGPRSASWQKLKPRTPRQMLPYLLLIWVINFLISSNLLFLMTSAYSMNTSGISPLSGHCHMQETGPVMQWLFVALMALRDIFFQSLMGWSSGYMAVHLYKHHQRVLSLRKARLQGNLSPELRAAHSILVLMTLFLLFYWGDFISSVYIGTFFSNNDLIISVKSFLIIGYASLSPFVLFTRPVRVSKCHSLTSRITPCTDSSGNLRICSFGGCI
ncbi:putative vomeronasal receptor-like protein 4 [Sorex fumeus]|uniref:putative vomeronasal receptor-like protein 4 n=1 Tax=Sorex fumeus TaxID=62283 RepID=UPI0024ADF93C|nr:putative vomeronasal receptor-like protein 4 [Sorex fumeus]